MLSLTDELPAETDPDTLFTAFAGWAEDRGLALYPHQEEALIEVVSGSNVILSTPTGSGKSLVAAGAHFAALAAGVRTFYTAPIKALVSEKFPGNFSVMTRLNVKEKPLDDVRVRQALSLALDRQAIANALGGGTGIVNGSIPTALTDCSMGRVISSSISSGPTLA